MIPESDKKYFRDVQDIDLTSDAGMIYFLNRKLLVWRIEDQRIPSIEQYFDRLDMEPYWKAYFHLYFKKYGTHWSPKTIS